MNATYSMELAKKRSGEEMDTVRVYRISCPGKVYYDVTFSESCTTSGDGEAVELVATYHNGRCIQYKES